MTPLAHFYTKQATLPPKKRAPIKNPDELDVPKLLMDIHCFECTEILPLVDQLDDALKGEYSRTNSLEAVDSILNGSVFLPAPRTWIEYKEDATKPRRDAFLLVEDPDRQGAVVYLFSLHAVTLLTRMDFRNFMHTKAFHGEHKDRCYLRLIAFLYEVLSMINTPKIIGRTQYMPNRALERRLTAKFGVGKFPLHAWTEINLSVTKPIEIDDGEPHEAHLTGRRALHFCRAHLRIKNGRVEYVKSHWRGDPAIGIKQSRYTVTA